MTLVINGRTPAGGRLYAAVAAYLPAGRLGAVAHSEEVARLSPYRGVREAAAAITALGGIIDPPWRG